MPIDRTGEISYNNFGSKMEIIRYNRNDDIDIYFEEYDWVFKNATYQCFKQGSIVCPYERRTYGVGYIGEGIYKTRENSKKTKTYIIWSGILKRCYSIEGKNVTYKNCEVCEEWHNFQNFAKWYEENYYECNKEKMHLDKDILYKGNKIYSPKTCIFVPQRINNLFTKRQNDRGSNKIGVTWHKRDKVYEVNCNNYNGKHKYLGRFKTEEEAYQSYKIYKEKVIKQVADEYKPYIPRELYDAMYRYKVEITD